MMASPHAQELTPEQRRFMGLPPSGPPTPQRSTPASPPPTATPPPTSGELTPAGPAMTFRRVETGGASCCEWVAADGVITIGTPGVFKAFLSSLGKEGPTLQDSITFNSPGGDFFAALALGREIRRDTRMWTAVGRTEAEPSDQAGGPETYRTSGGVCLSACVLAFMGGKTRVYQRGAGATQQTLAFKSFAIDQPASVLGRQSADAMDGGGLPAPGLLRLAMEGYAAEMGISPTFVAFMETASQPGGVRVLSQDEADVLGMNTPSAARTKWTLSVRRGGLVLYGSGEDRWTHYTTSLQCLAGHRGSLEYTIAVPVDAGDQPSATVADGYRQGIQGVHVEAGGVSTAGSIANIQLLSGKLLVTTWLATPQVALFSHGDASIAFDMPHSLANVLPDVELVSPQVTGAVDMLLRNCPNG
jgi:hypothetical protein